jgi:hypothetical protein
MEVNDTVSHTIYYSAMTLSITTLSIMTYSIIINEKVRLSIMEERC